MGAHEMSENRMFLGASGGNAGDKGMCSVSKSASESTNSSAMASTTTPARTVWRRYNSLCLQQALS